jgi:hypothetical protein
VQQKINIYSKIVLFEQIRCLSTAGFFWLFLRLTDFFFHRKGDENAKKRYYSFSVERMAKEKTLASYAALMSEASGQ